MKAFPSISFDSAGQITSLEDGMNLRDYFAAKAMQSLINEKYWHDPKGGIHQINIAEDCYAMADAMMEARK
jgi:hypothetical protein